MVIALNLEYKCILIYILLCMNIFFVIVIDIFYVLESLRGPDKRKACLFKRRVSRLIAPYVVSGKGRVLLK